MLFGILALTDAFSQFIIKGEFRPRFEYRSGYKSLIPSSSDAAIGVSQRSRITFNYQTGKFSFGLGIQDVRVWGDESYYNSIGVYGDNASLDLNEAWIAMNVCPAWTIKVGRQYWIYDDERLLSERNWNQSSIKYDGVLFKFLQNKWQFDAGFSWNTAKDTTSGNEYTPKKIKTENFLYLKKPVTDWLTISAIAMATGYTPNDTTATIYVKGTYGINFDIKKGNFKFYASGYYQNGQSRSGKDVGAFLAHAKTSYTFGKFLGRSRF